MPAAELCDCAVRVVRDAALDTLLLLLLVTLLLLLTLLLVATLLLLSFTPLLLVANLLLLLLTLLLVVATLLLLVETLLELAALLLLSRDSVLSDCDLRTAELLADTEVALEVLEAVEVVVTALEALLVTRLWRKLDLRDTSEILVSNFLMTWLAGQELSSMLLSSCWVWAASTSAVCRGWAASTAASTVSCWPPPLGGAAPGAGWASLVMVSPQGGAMLAPDFMTCFSPAAALRLELVLSPAAVFCLAWAWLGLAPRLLSAATLELVFSLSEDPPASDLVDTSLQLVKLMGT